MRVFQFHIWLVFNACGNSSISLTRCTIGRSNALINREGPKKISIAFTLYYLRNHPLQRRALLYKVLRLRFVRVSIKPVGHFFQLPRYGSPLRFLRMLDERVLAVTIEQIAQFVHVSLEDIALFLPGGDRSLFRFHLDHATRMSELHKGRIGEKRLTVAALHASARAPWVRRT
jgi:hypothetical protein